jgi:hypothetical protein
MYVVALLLFVVMKGRGYYLAAGYPMLYAAGCVWGERRLASWSGLWTGVARTAAWTALAANIALTAVLLLPMAPINSEWWKRASGAHGDFREELGWPELVETVARVRDSLPREDRARLGILAGNYGEAGAINLYGPSYGLPRAISGINSFWLRGYGDPPPERLIVVGIGPRYLGKHFSSCRVVAHTWNRFGVENEETADHPDIFVCGGLRGSWPEFWREFRYFG